MTPVNLAPVTLAPVSATPLEYIQYIPHTYSLPEPLLVYKFIAFPIALLFVLNCDTVRIILKLQYCHDWIIFYVYILDY